VLSGESSALSENERKEKCNYESGGLIKKGHCV
jgi:hypothetical protein